MFDSTPWKIKLWAFDSARFLYTIIWSDHLTCDLNSFVQIVGRLFLPASLLKVALGHWCCLQNWRDLSKRALSFFLGEIIAAFFDFHRSGSAWEKKIIVVRVWAMIKRRRGGSGQKKSHFPTPVLRWSITSQTSFRSCRKKSLQTVTGENFNFHHTT